MDIDAVIAEATKVAEPAQASTEASKDVAKPEQEAQEVDAKKEEAPENIGAKPDSELTPEQLAKREANRQSHLNSKLARLRRENRELKELAERNAKPQTPQNTQQAEDGRPVAPNQDNFDTWADYQAARDAYVEQLADWKVERKLAEKDYKAVETAKTSQDNAQLQQRIVEIASQAEKFAKENPEYTALYSEYSDFMDNLPKPVEKALLLADNPTLALYTLMKEGTLESLEDMSPEKVSMEIGKAELRGQGYINRNKATNAPSPISPARGTGSTSKSLESMSVEDLLKKFNTR